LWPSVEPVADVPMVCLSSAV